CCILFALLFRHPLSSRRLPYTTLFRSRVRPGSFRPGSWTPSARERVHSRTLQKPVAALTRRRLPPPATLPPLPPRTPPPLPPPVDRKSTRLNSSHVKTSYAVFCLKKKT